MFRDDVEVSLAFSGRIGRTYDTLKQICTVFSRVNRTVNQRNCRFEIFSDNFAFLSAIFFGSLSVTRGPVTFDILSVKFTAYAADGFSQ